MPGNAPAIQIHHPAQAMPAPAGQDVADLETGQDTLDGGDQGREVGALGERGAGLGDIQVVVLGPVRFKFGRCQRHGWACFCL